MKEPSPRASRQALQVWMKFLVVGSSRPGLSLAVVGRGPVRPLWGSTF